MKKTIPIIIFLILNILLSPIITVPLICLYWGGLIMMEEPFKTNIIFLWIIFFIFLFRVLLFPNFYRINKNKDNFLCGFFNKIKNDRNFATKILVVSFLIDFISVFVFNIILAIFANIVLGLTDFFIMFLFPYFFSGYGLFFAYLSLLFYTRIIEERFRQRGFFNIIICLLFLIMFVPITIVLLVVFV